MRYMFILFERWTTICSTFSKACSSLCRAGGHLCKGFILFSGFAEKPLFKDSFSDDLQYIEKRSSDPGQAECA